MTSLPDGNVVLPVNAHHFSLVTLRRNEDVAQRFPVIGVWTDIIDHDDALLSSKDLESGIPVYTLEDIEVEDPTSIWVMTRFRRLGANESDSPVFDQNIHFSMRLPIHYLAVMQSLRFAPDGFFLALFDDRIAHVVESKVVSIQDVAVAVAFPDEGSPESDEIIQKMSALVSNFYTEPLVNEDDSEESEFVYPPATRKAQSFLMASLVGTALGDVASFKRFISMEPWIEEFVEYRLSGLPGKDRDNDHDAFVDSVITLLEILMSRSTVDETPEDMGLESSEVAPFGSGVHDEEFLALMKNSGIETNLVSIGAESNAQGSEILRLNAQIASVRNPYANGCPTSMENIKAFIESDPDLSARPKLWETNFEGDISFLKNYPASHVMTAYLLVVAARGVRFTRAMATNAGNEDIDSTAHPSIIFAQWLNADGDTFMWEVTSMGPLLENYETVQFSDMISSTVKLDADPSAAYYLGHVLHSIGHKLVSEEWTGQTLAEAFDKLDLKTKDFNLTKQLATYFIDELLEKRSTGTTSEELPCFSYSTVADLLNSGLFDLPQFAAGTATLIPMLADIQAAKHDLSVGSDDWKNFRNKYISDLLRSVVDGTERRFNTK